MAEDSSFGIYTKRVLEQVKPDHSIKGETVETIDRITRILVEKVMNSVNKILRNDPERKTVSARDIQAGVRLAFPGEIAKHAVSEANKAVTRFNASTETGGKAGRAGLVFPPSRIEKLIRLYSVQTRVSASAPVYLAGAIEYIIAEILEMAGNVTTEKKRQRIKLSDVSTAINGDEELSKLFRDIKLTSDRRAHHEGPIFPYKPKRSSRKADEEDE